MIERGFERCSREGSERGRERGEGERERGERREERREIATICKIFASGFGFKLGIMRGFQIGITLGGRTSANFYLMGLQNRVAKKFAKFLHLSVELSRVL